MPIYEYKCDACGADFEALVRGSEEPTCPDCNSPSVRKRMSAPSSPHVNGASADTPCGQPRHSCGCGGNCCCGH
ncbi:MAG: zinc ribbon domain-containing protein [Planctomycetia bacterium]|nr:zinc ribbon domain-containing protein [Planctomycetia bacterium]